MDVLHQDLPDTLYYAAGDLAVNQKRIDDGADIVDDAVAHDVDRSGFLVDLYFTDVGAVREVLGVDVEHRRGNQASLHTLRQFGRISGCSGYVVDGEGLVCLRRREDTVFELEIVDADLKRMRGNLLGLYHDLFGGIRDS